MYPESEGNEEQWIAERLENHNLAESSKLVRLDDGRWMNVVESRTSSGFLAGFRTDVTALRNSEDLLQATLDSVSEAVVTLSTEGRVLNLNAASQDIFGYTLEELKGQHVLTIAPETGTTALRKNLLQRATRSAVGATQNNIDTVLVRKNREKFTARVETRDVEINGERVFLNFITDLTKERRFENTVQALGAAVEQLAAGFVLVNEVHQITYSNNQFSYLLDIPSSSKLMGLTIDELLDLVVRSQPELKLSAFPCWRDCKHLRCRRWTGYFTDPGGRRFAAKAVAGGQQYDPDIDRHQRRLPAPDAAGAKHQAGHAG